MRPSQSLGGRGRNASARSVVQSARCTRSRHRKASGGRSRRFASPFLRFPLDKRAPQASCAVAPRATLTARTACYTGKAEQSPLTLFVVRLAKDLLGLHGNGGIFKRYGMTVQQVAVFRLHAHLPPAQPPGLHGRLVAQRPGGLVETVHQLLGRLIAGEPVEVIPILQLVFHFAPLDPCARGTHRECRCTSPESPRSRRSRRQVPEPRGLPGYTIPPLCPGSRSVLLRRCFKARHCREGHATCPGLETAAKKWGVGRGQSQLFFSGGTLPYDQELLTGGGFGGTGTSPGVIRLRSFKAAATIRGPAVISRLL